MSEGLYERYKDALRRGHVAALRDRLDVALSAYREAAAMAPERSLPHASIGSIHLRKGDLQDAIAAFDAALHRSHGDETALAGRADALVRTGRRAEAADTLDHLAAVLDKADRTSEACDTARRALELAESKTRRRHVEQLTQRLRAVAGDDSTERVLARALHILELDAVGPFGEGSDSAPTAGGEADETPVEVMPEPEPEPPADLETALGLTAEAEAAIDAGDAALARDRLLAAAAVHQRGGRLNAALDACYEGLAFEPSDPALHLALVALFLECGWRGPAADKLALLGRLIDLTGDAAGRERLCAVVSARFADDPRLTALCA